MENSENSFGKRFIGVTFNPSNSDKVYKAKELSADLVDLINNEIGVKLPEQLTYEQKLLWDKALGDILTAQMTVVKLLTLPNKVD
jgi:hypothetical protein